MKKLLVLFVLLFTTVGFAQEAEATTQLAPEFSALWDFFGPAITGLFLALFADASKYIKAGTWDTGVFIKTKAKPFLITTVVAIAIYYSLIFVPFLKPFLEVLAESEFTQLTAAGLFGFAGAIIDGFTKKKEVE